MTQAANGFDLIIDTVPNKHDLNPYLPLLDVDGTLVIVGQVGPLDEMSSVPLLLGRRRVAGSPIGGIAQTQELLDFCARKNILPETRNDPHGRDQRGLRADGALRRALPLRDRHGVADGARGCYVLTEGTANAFEKISDKTKQPRDLSLAWLVPIAWRVVLLNRVAECTSKVRSGSGSEIRSLAGTSDVPSKAEVRPRLEYTIAAIPLGGFVIRNSACGGRSKRPFRTRRRVGGRTILR